MQIPKALKGQVRKIKHAWQDEDGDWCVVTKLQPEEIKCYSFDDYVATLIGVDGRTSSHQKLEQMIVDERTKREHDLIMKERAEKP